MNNTILQSASHVRSSSRISRSVLAGRILTGIALAFLTFDVSLKIAQVKEAVDGTAQLGFAASAILPLGIIELVCLVLYVIPRTAPLGAVLFTAYLGGAVAIHVQQGNPMFSHILFPVYVAILLWGGLYLRDARVRGVLVGTR